MSISPRVNFVDLVLGQSVPEVTVNEMGRRLEQGATHFIFKDRDLATPPGSPVDGDCYLVAGSPTGAWTGHAADIAFYMNTAWEFIEVIEGFTANINDEDIMVRYDGAAWVAITANASPSTVSTQSGTAYTAVLGDANGFIRFTNGSAINFTIPTNASVAFPIGSTIEFEQAGAGALSLVAAGGVTINSRGADLTLAGQYSVGAVKKVATNTWTAMGDF